MSKATLIALLLGTLLIAAPFSRVSAEEQEYEGDEEGDDDAGAASSSDEKDVLVLTTKNFDETVKAHKYVLAEFYAPWCGHCKSLAPQYAKAATALKSHDADVVLAKIDATVESELGTKFNVQGYPTLKWFVNGESVEYNGPRDADGIVAWVKKKTGPATTLVEDAAKLTSLESETAAIALAYYADLKGADYDAFKAVAQKIEDVTFVDTTVAAVAKAAGLTKPGIVFIKNFKGEPRATVVYSGKVTSEDLTTWVNGEKLPLIMEFNEANSDKIFNSGIKQQVLIWANSAQLTPGDKVFDTAKAVAADFKGKLIFVSVNTDEEGAEPVTNFFGLKGAESPQIVGFFMDKNKKYKMSGDLTAAALKTFAQGVVDGTAPVEYKSAPIPEDNKDGEVIVVVGKTVDEIVFDESKDVFIEVYAPWCGHCKQLEPTWKKLAKRFKKVDSVVIAKMDGTENEHPDLEIKGFPTLFFKPAGGKELLQFEESDRSLKGLTKYIKDHAKVPFTLPKKSKADSSEEAKAEEAELAKEAAGDKEDKPAKDEL